MSDAAKLADLRDHWGSAYVIQTMGQRWLAWWRADFVSDVLRAATADELRRLIRADYDQRTVSTRGARSR